MLDLKKKCATRVSKNARRDPNFLVNIDRTFGTLKRRPRRRRAAW